MLKNTGLSAATLLFTTVAVALCLTVVVMLGRGQSPGMLSALAVAAAIAVLLAYGNRRRDAGHGARSIWMYWVEAEAGTRDSSAPPESRRPMGPYTFLFAVLYGGLIAAAVFGSATMALEIPQVVYLLLVWIADQVTLVQFARQAGRPLLREELVRLFSGTGLVIVLAELPTVLALTRYGAWDGTSVALFAATAVAVFTVHYFALTRMPVYIVRRLGLEVA